MTPPGFPVSLRALCAACAFLFIGCVPAPPVTESPPEPIRAERPLYEWYDDGGPGEVRILINLSAQRAYYSRGGRPIGWSYVATGREGFNTPAGNYRITEKIVDKHSNRYGWIENEYGETIDHDASPGDRVPPGARYVPAPMPYWMRLTSYGIGMHAGTIPRPGAPASHGCIRLPKPFAPQLFEAVRVGTPVTVEYGPPSLPGEIHPAGQVPPEVRERRAPDGRRIVSPNDPWIVPPAARSRR
ncbi:MAG: L,D-transpeptidase [Akkermansiaceae bacterium]|nr:L,D-transpeptidase [Akkermansiaceae bacterium]NNM28181.1 L,D-transpeptidase [Akkermansiaceae bacterium]